MSAAETLSFKITAVRLGVTISAVSHRISSLEDELGVELFDRTSRSLKLTLAGTRYFDQIRPIMQHFQYATDDLRGSGAGPVLRIASFPIFFSSWLIPRLEKFAALYPDARFECIRLGSGDAPPDISIAPIGRSFKRSRVPEGGTLLFNWLVAPICHPSLIEQYNVREPGDLANVPLIDLTFPLDSWKQWLREAGVSTDPKRKIATFDTPHLSYDAVFAGLGACLSSNVLGQHFIRQGLVMPFNIFIQPSGGVYISLRQEAPHLIAAAFKDWVIAEMATSGADLAGRTD